MHFSWKYILLLTANQPNIYLVLHESDVMRENTLRLLMDIVQITHELYHTAIAFFS
jgi:hypothetical protein